MPTTVTESHMASSGHGHWRTKMLFPICWPNGLAHRMHSAFSLVDSAALGRWVALVVRTVPLHMHLHLPPTSGCLWTCRKNGRGPSLMVPIDVFFHANTSQAPWTVMLP
jgi:hypothetical protein